MTFSEYFNLWEAKQRLDPKCWTGYRKDGTKMKGGKRVNNCVKEGINNVNPDLEELISKFTNEVLSQYTFTTAGEGHLNCAWVTQAFCKFSEQNGKPCKAIMLVWPTEEVVKKLKTDRVLPPYYENQGEGHIAPVVDNTIIDFAIGQFYPKEEIRLTPLDKWQDVYGKFGYGTNKIYGKTYFVDTYENIDEDPNIVGKDGMNPVAPPLKGKLSERFNNYVKENFADGKNPEHKGDSKRYGVPTKSSVSNLRKVAKQGGRKGQLAHWMANMKAGKAKKK